MQTQAKAHKNNNNMVRKESTIGCKTNYDWMMSFDSELTKSTDDADEQGEPQLERAPLIHWIAERIREKVSLHRNQDRVELYGWSHFVARHEAKHL